MEAASVDLINDLKQILSESQVTENQTVRELHGRDESYHAVSLPDIVVFPETAQQVSEVVKLANKYKIPMVPFGLGSSLEGHVIPYNHGITIDFSLMNKILEVRENDFLVKVQPGGNAFATKQRIEKKYGLFFFRRSGS
ncbi:FAD-binding oxidoreductase [Peribacillus frigoritolerans]|nr:FAD-binding oxidoreductase [Peribacillus frigoritolerans]